MDVLDFNSIPYAGHFPECENYEGYYCKRCDRFFEAGKPSRNYCDYCGKFAARIVECICPEIKSGRI